MITQRMPPLYQLLMSQKLEAEFPEQQQLLPEDEALRTEADALMSRAEDLSAAGFRSACCNNSLHTCVCCCVSADHAKPASARINSTLGYLRPDGSVLTKHTRCLGKHSRAVSHSLASPYSVQCRQWKLSLLFRNPDEATFRRFLAGRSLTAQPGEDRSQPPTQEQASTTFAID